MELNFSLSALVNLADISRYQKIGNEEILILADIENSTEAVANGKYKNVNISTTQCIASIRYACGKPLKIQHGGDGFVLIAHVSDMFKIAGTMTEMRDQILEDFNLKIRCAYWNSSELNRLNVSIHYHSFSFNGGNQQWQFHSNDIHKLEQLMREGDKSIYKLLAREKPDMNGFRCDFTPLFREGASYGCGIIDFSLMDLTERFISIRKILELIVATNENHLEPPFTIKELVWQTDKYELKTLAARTDHYRTRILFDFVYHWINKLGLHWNSKWSPMLFKDLHKLPLSVDFIKYDGQLKFIVCIADTNKDRFYHELNSLAELYNFKIGFHWSEKAVITCSVSSEEGNMHFIDGEDGGLTLASRQLKKLLSVQEHTLGKMLN